ncbi:MAG: TonB-dependent receptor plug domain-containing protein [Tannerella sp.]|jgi:hypothetical protein|nr:TonB-dependent receptor plug domain-containing protein [Tannerella sp.]
MISKIKIPVIKCLWNILLFIPFVHSISAQNRTEEEKTIRLNEVTVTSNAPDERIKSLSMGVEKLSAKEIKQLPALMGEVDVLKVIQLMPGVHTVSEGSSGYSVRGGSPDQNLILTDNSTVYNPSHLLGFFSIFNNDVLKSAELYKGDMPMKYGGRISSLLAVSTKKERPDKFGGTGGIGLISSRLALEGTAGEKTSWLAGGRRSYADLFLKLSSNKDLRKSAVYFYDFNANLIHRFSNKDVLEVNGYYGKDHFEAQPGVFYYGNGAASLSWKHVYSYKLFSSLSFNFSDYNYALESKLDDVQAIWTSGLRDYMLRMDFSHEIDDVQNMSYGFTSTLHDIRPGHVSFMGSVDYRISNFKALEHTVYWGGERKLSESFAFKCGVRVSAFQNMGKSTVYTYDESYRASDSTTYKAGKIYNTYYAVEPRSGFVYRMGAEASIKGNYVHNVQFMQLAGNSASGSPLDVWFMAGPNIKPQVADMFSAGYFKNWRNNMYESSVEFYYKDQKNVIDFAEHSSLLMNEKLEGEVRSGKGRAYGAEFMLRKNKGSLTGFVNYTLSRSERTVAEINQGKTYVSPYDRTHSLNIVANYALSKKFILSAIWVYATGNPATYPSGRFEIEGEYYPIYSGRNEYRHPDYHRLDLSMTYIPGSDSKKRLKGEWNVSFYNAYGKKNPWMIHYSQDMETGRPYAEMIYLFGIVPSLSYNFKF